MISYRFDEEPDYLNYYLDKMNDTQAKRLLAAAHLGSSNDAEYLAKFFWRMVDFSIAEEEQGIELSWPESREFWNEKLMNSISGFIEREGYGEVWEKVLDEV